MPHDVFISYPSINKLIADAVCAKLEENKIRCWIAPRDVLPGEKWGGTIIKAIDNSKIMILIFSKEANVSPHILNEVNRALNNGNIIIPFRIDEITPEDNLAYYLETAHWLDAFTPPIEKHIEKLIYHVNNYLQSNITPLKAEYSYSFSNENCKKLSFLDSSQGHPNQFSWDFGDGESSNERNPEHIFKDSGEYLVTLSISDNKQQENVSKTILISDTPIVPSFLYNIETSEDSIVVHFFDKTQPIADKYLWNFGDDTISTDRHPIHKYEKSGAYTITLIVMMGNQNKSMSIDINIEGKPRKQKIENIQSKIEEIEPYNKKINTPINSTKFKLGDDELHNRKKNGDIDFSATSIREQNIITANKSMIALGITIVGIICVIFSIAVTGGFSSESNIKSSSLLMKPSPVPSSNDPYTSSPTLIPAGSASNEPISIYKAEPINKPGEYILKKDIRDEIKIESSNVIIKGNGHSITTDGMYGISAYGVKNIEISGLIIQKDGILETTSTGIYFEDVTNSKIYDDNINGFGTTIQIKDGSHNVIKDNHLFGTFPMKISGDWNIIQDNVGFNSGGNEYCESYEGNNNQISGNNIQPEC